MEYRGLNVAITGGTGFIGSHLVNHMIASGANVFILCRDSFKNGVFDAKNVNIIYGNGAKKEDVDYFVEKSKPDIFIHLAAQTQALYSMDYPYETVFNNTVMTLNVLESLSKYQKCKKIIVASSDKAYGELLADEYKEDHVLGGTFPYDASKSVTDIFVKTYRTISKLNIVSVRHCNVYGAGDLNFQRLIPGIAKHYVDNKQFILRNMGNDVREYIYIDDVISSYNSILEYMNDHDDVPAFNLGSGDRMTTTEVFNTINNSIDNVIDFKLEPETYGEINKQVMSYDLLNSKTGWKPKYSAKEYMPQTFQWYVDWLNK